MKTQRTSILTTPTHQPTRVLPIQFIYLNKKIKIEVPDPVEVNAISWNREQVSESHTNTFNSFTVNAEGARLKLHSCVDQRRLG
jgi:hypothetical protein